MVQYIIDSDRCNQCGICSQVCLSSVIIPDPITNTPFVSADRREFCTACGHCEAFCPRGAIRIESSELVSFPGNQGTPEIRPEEVKSLVAKRRTIRQFQNIPISEEELINLLDLVRYAPSGFNLHPVEWMIVTDPVVIQNLSSTTISWLRSLEGDGNSDEYTPLLPVIPQILAVRESGGDPVCYHAPALIIAHADRKIQSAGYDAIIGLSYLDLFAQVYHLGTCWGGLLKMALSGSPDVLDLLPLPAGHIPHHVLLIGKPLHQVCQIPKRTPGKVSFV